MAFFATRSLLRWGRCEFSPGFFRSRLVGVARDAPGTILLAFLFHRPELRLCRLFASREVFFFGVDAGVPGKKLLDRLDTAALAAVLTLLANLAARVPQVPGVDSCSTPATISRAFWPLSRIFVSSSCDDASSSPPICTFSGCGFGGCFLPLLRYFGKGRDCMGFSSSPSSSPSMVASEDCPGGFFRDFLRGIGSSMDPMLCCWSWVTNSATPSWAGSALSSFNKVRKRLSPIGRGGTFLFTCGLTAGARSAVMTARSSRCRSRTSARGLWLLLFSVRGRFGLSGKPLPGGGNFWYPLLAFWLREANADFPERFRSLRVVVVACCFGGARALPSS